jgi:hypothetical protein
MKKLTIKSPVLAGSVNLLKFQRKIGEIADISELEFKTLEDAKDLLVLLEMNLENCKRNEMDTFVFVVEGGHVIHFEMGNLNHPLKNFDSVSYPGDVFIVCNFEIYLTFVEELKNKFSNLRGIICPHIDQKALQDLEEYYHDICVLTDAIISRKRDSSGLSTLTGINQNLLVSVHKHGSTLLHVNAEILNIVESRLEQVVN